MNGTICPFCQVRMLRVTKWQKYICQVCGREFSFAEMRDRQINEESAKARIKLNRPSKYNAAKVALDGLKFDSKKEARMYELLKEMEKNGLIKNLKVHPSFTLLTGYRHYKSKKKIRPIKYVADFSFFDVSQNRFRIIDCKGYKTKVYLMKKKMFDKKFLRRGWYLEETV